MGVWRFRHLRVGFRQMSFLVPIGSVLVVAVMGEGSQLGAQLANVQRIFRLHSETNQLVYR